jgi:hypothetical protein
VQEDDKDVHEVVYWCLVSMVGILVILNYFIFIPWLVNRHNDGAMIAAVLLVIGGVALPRLFYVKVLRPFARENKE